MENYKITKYVEKEAIKDASEITQYFACAQCLEEKPESTSLRTYRRISVGFTPDKAIQVWCDRHNREIVTLLAQECAAVADGCDLCNNLH